MKNLILIFVSVLSFAGISSAKCPYAKNLQTNGVNLANGGETNFINTMKSVSSKMPQPAPVSIGN